ncbi:hypothetical protein ACRAWG_35360 [Methylobacterium sp. P31]
MSWRSGNAVAAAVVTGGLMLGSAANAAPVGPTLAGEAHNKSGVTDVAMVCGPFGCHWRPGWGYGPRPYWRRPYWHRPYWGRRCWWRPTPWGPRRVCRY